MSTWGGAAVWNRNSLNLDSTSCAKIFLQNISCKYHQNDHNRLIFLLLRLEKKGSKFFIVTQGSLFFIFERIETPECAMCAQLSKCATQSVNWDIPPPWARWRIVCTTWWRRPSPPVPRGRRSSPMTEKYREKSRIHPSMLNLPGNHLRWRCHCRRAAQKWCAKACLDAPIWREKICNLCMY